MIHSSPSTRFYLWSSFLRDDIKSHNIVRIFGTFVETVSGATGVSVPTLTKIVVATIVATIIIYTTQEEDAKVHPVPPGAVDGNCCERLRQLTADEKDTVITTALILQPKVEEKLEDFVAEELAAPTEAVAEAVPKAEEVVEEVVKAVEVASEAPLKEVNAGCCWLF